MIESLCADAITAGIVMAQNPEEAKVDITGIIEIDELTSLMRYLTGG